MICRMILRLLILSFSGVILLHPTPYVVTAAAGDLDPSFGSGGKVITDLGGFDNIRALVIQNDGKIIATGSGRNVFALARYNTNGSLDPEFSGDGKVSTDFVPNAFFQQASALALQPDGKIIARGYAGSRFEPWLVTIPTALLIQALAMAERC